MTNFQAVIGLGQLRRLDALLEKRQKIEARYNEAFGGNHWFKAPLRSRTVQYYTPKWKNRDGLNEFLARSGIHTGMHFKPLHTFTLWKPYKTVDLPNTEQVFTEILSLPVHDALTDEQQEYVIKRVGDFYGGH